MTVRRVIPAVAMVMALALALAVVWYALDAREDVAVESPPYLPAQAAPVSSGVPQQQSAAPTPEAAAPPGAATPVTSNVQQLIADANGGDAARRAAAIGALARAPRAQAVPALRQVLSNGTSVDRPLALKSLQELALEQGDADGAVRAAIREVIYHGDDESLMAAAQDTLDVVEESELK